MKLKKYKLGELIEVTRGASLSGEYYATQGEYIRLTCGNFDYHNNCFKENKSKDNIYYVGKFRDEFLMEEGDIITPLTEQAVGLLGSTALIPESGKYIQSQDVAKITCNEKLLDKKFAFYLISSSLVKQQLSAAAQQTKIRHTSPDKIKDCVVWIPEMSEQRLIGTLLSTIDQKISLNRQVNHYLEAMVKQLYDYWFVQFDFPDVNGKPYKSSGGKMVWNEKLKREIPEGWSNIPLRDFADIYNGATPSTEVSSNYGGDIIWITPKDLSDQQSKFTYYGYRNITSAGYNSCSTRLLPAKTILLSSRAPIGLISIAMVDLCTNQGFKSLVCKDLQLYAYLYYYIRRHIKQIEQLGTGTTFKEVSREDLCTFPILEVKSTELMQQWFNQIEPVFMQQYELIKEINYLSKKRDELLPLLMNGQVSVKQLNNDL